MNFTDLIKVNYTKLTLSEQKIADYILKDSEFFLQSNAQTIGDVTKTSGATVIRFCKKLGFDGLEQLKVAIAKSSLSIESEQEIDPIIQSSDTNEVLVSKIYSHIETALKRTINLIDYSELEEILSIIKNARRIYLYGIGASSLSAYDLYHKFNRINKTTFYGLDGHMNIEFAVHSTPQDVAIAISYGGNSKEIILAVERLRKNNTPIIAIVKEGETPLSQYADYCLYVPNADKQVRMGALNSKFSQNFLIDIIYFGIVKNSLNEVLDQLKLTTEVTRALKQK